MLEDFNIENRHKNYLKKKWVSVSQRFDEKIEEIKNKREKNYKIRNKKFNENLKIKEENLTKTINLKKKNREIERKKLGETIKQRIQSAQETLENILNKQEETILKKEGETFSKCIILNNFQYKSLKIELKEKKNNHKKFIEIKWQKYKKFMIKILKS